VPERPTAECVERHHVHTGRKIIDAVGYRPQVGIARYQVHVVHDVTIPCVSTGSRCLQQQVSGKDARHLKSFKCKETFLNSAPRYIGQPRVVCVIMSTLKVFPSPWFLGLKWFEHTKKNIYPLHVARPQQRWASSRPAKSISTPCCRAVSVGRLEGRPTKKNSAVTDKPRDAFMQTTFAYVTVKWSWTVLGSNTVEVVVSHASLSIVYE